MDQLMFLILIQLYFACLSVQQQTVNTTENGTTANTHSKTATAKQKQQANKIPTLHWEAYISRDLYSENIALNYFTCVQQEEQALRKHILL